MHRRLKKDMKKITLEKIKAWRDARLAETKDAEERQEIMDKAKLQAYYLGALDKYARVTKEPYGEFWERQKEEGYEYKIGHLPEWGNPCADDLVSFGHAYNWGEDEGDAAAEEYGSTILPLLARDADKESVLINAATRVKTYLEKEAYARAKRRAEELWRRYNSDECGWGENWWND